MADVFNSSKKINVTDDPLSKGPIFDSVGIEWRIAFLALRIMSVLSNLAFAVAVYADRTSKAGPRLLIGNLAVSGFLLSCCLFTLNSLQEWMPPGFVSSPCSVTSVAFFLVQLSVGPMSVWP